MRSVGCIVSVLLVGLVATASAAPSEGPEMLTLNPLETCVTDDPGIIEVEVVLDGIVTPINGVQFNLAWNPDSCWQVEKAEDDARPAEGWTQIGEEIDFGSVFYAVNRVDAVTEAGVVAVIRFTSTLDENACCVEEICLDMGVFPETKVFGDPAPYASYPTFGECQILRNDAEPPEIACGPDKYVYTLPGVCWWKPADAGDPIEKPVVTDNCDDDTCPTGTSYWREDKDAPDKGLNNKYWADRPPVDITWTATDCCGQMDECVQVIDVHDNEAPTILPDGGRTEVYADEYCLYELEDVRDIYTITDNCDPDPQVVQDPMPGGIYGLGPIDIVIGANDSHGNNATVNGLITVVDVLPPTFTIVPENIEMCADAGECGAMVEWAIGAEDECGAACTICDPPSGSTFPIGTTSVTCTAKDESDNTTEVTFEVTVRPCWNLDVTVELRGFTGPRPFDRCMEFELSDCEYGALAPVVLNDVMTFETGVGNLQMEVPVPEVCIPGMFDCMRAQDVRYSMWSNIAPPSIYVSPDQRTIMAQWVGDDALMLGDLNGDNGVDLWDWHVWLSQAQDPTLIPELPADLCDPAFLDPTLFANQHSDFSGDHRVTSTDFGHIYDNFGLQGDWDCCSVNPVPALATSMTVEELESAGMGLLIKYDRNHDGVVDVQDLRLRTDGAKTKRTRVRR